MHDLRREIARRSAVDLVEIVDRLGAQAGGGEQWGHGLDRLAFGLVITASIGSWASHADTRSACHRPDRVEARVGDPVDIDSDLGRP
ncbi:MAG: hypothetical protein R2695_02620 [Acidimicrobiales bacterium]